MGDEEEVDDLLAGMDDLDDNLFGRKTAPSKQRANISNLDSIFGESSASRPASSAKKPAVSFASTPLPAKPVVNRSVLDDLFQDEPPATSAQVSRPSRLSPSNTSSNDFLGPSTARRQTPARAAEPLFGSNAALSATPATTPTIAVTQPALTAVAAPVASANQDLVRIQRLENEAERLNREIDDLKRRKKEDEEELEKLWKDRLAKREKEHEQNLEETKILLQRAAKKVETEHEEELERLRSTYERQLDSMQATAGQSKDITSMVEKVDDLSSTIGKLATDMSTSNERSFVEREMNIRLKEQQIQMKEERLTADLNQFQEERLKIYELNAKLNDMCKGTETAMAQEKYKIREDLVRLKAEKHIFKEDQQYILHNIEDQRKTLEKAKMAFYGEQHDLLIRVSNERAGLEQEKIEFHSKRAIDVRRLKEEAAELQNRIKNVQLAENHAEQLKQHYESKLRQLQELEVSLMEECVELEKLRNQYGSPEFREHSSKERKRIGKMEQMQSVDLTAPDFFEDLPKRNESVRTVLKKHSEFLEKYTGQKIAAVAPQSASYESS